MSEDTKLFLSITLSFLVVWFVFSLKAIFTSNEPKETLYNCIFAPSTDEGMLVAIGCIVNWFSAIGWLIYWIFHIL